MTAIRASLIRETNCDASMPTPVAVFVDRRPPVTLTAPRHPAPAPMSLRSASSNVTKASAGTRRKRPIRTDCQEHTPEHGDRRQFMFGARSHEGLHDERTAGGRSPTSPGAT